MSAKQEIIIVYDGECPFCRQYCKLVRLRESVGSVLLVDARSPSVIMTEITRRGLDIDEGMVVKYQERLYYGSEAVHILSYLSSHKDTFNWINGLVFRSKKAAFFIYPFLRDCRNFALWCLKVPKINNLKRGEDNE